jgi:hypothetical protein
MSHDQALYRKQLAGLDMKLKNQNSPPKGRAISSEIRNYTGECMSSQK